MEIESILVAIDGSESARHALHFAISFTARLGAELTAIAVVGKLPAYAATVGEVEEVKREKDRFSGRLLQEAKAQAAEQAVDLDIALVTGQPAKAIVRFAEQRGHDMVIVGHHRHFLGDYLLGSTADRVAHQAHCPVIVVR